VPVVETVVAFRPDGADLGLWPAKMPALRRLVAGSPLAEVDPRLADERDVVLVKLWPSAFHGTPLGSILRSRGVDTVVVCGCTTSGCVRATIVDAFSEGYRVLVPVDAVVDHDPAPREANRCYDARRYCDLSTVDEVVNYLERVGVTR
jgi:maleamate amidohydrolase